MFRLLLLNEVKVDPLEVVNNAHLEPYIHHLVKHRGFGEDDSPEDGPASMTAANCVGTVVPSRECTFKH